MLIPILLIAGFVWVCWAVVSMSRQRKSQRAIEENAAKQQLAEFEAKGRCEAGRNRRTTVQEWEKEFKILDATQFFNPRRNGRADKLNLGRHDYRAEIEQSVSESGQRFRRLVVSDKQGHLVKVRVITDNMETSAYRECILSDSNDRIIGGWQLAHEEIPYEFTVASINRGYVYSDKVDLPTTVPVGYEPRAFAAGWITVVYYAITNNGKVEEFAEKYLEENFSAILRRYSPGSEIDFKKSAREIHFSLDVPDERLTTPARRDADVKRPKEERNESTADNRESRPALANPGDLVAVSPQALGSMLLRQKELQAAVAAGKSLSGEERKESVMLELILGSAHEESLIKTHELSLEDAKDIRAIGEFTFGEINSLLTAQGFSREGVMSFLENIQSGAMTTEQAIQFFRDCKEWESIEGRTNMSREEFFAMKLAAAKQSQTNRPSNN